MLLGKKQYDVIRKLNFYTELITLEFPFAMGILPMVKLNSHNCKAELQKCVDKARFEARGSGRELVVQEICFFS